MSAMIPASMARALLERCRAYQGFLAAGREVAKIRHKLNDAKAEARKRHKKAKEAHKRVDRVPENRNETREAHKEAAKWHKQTARAHKIIVRLGDELYRAERRANKKHRKYLEIRRRSYDLM